MEKPITLTPNDGNFKQGFDRVTLRLGPEQDGIALTGKLPPARALPILYRQWQQQYQALLNSPLLNPSRGFKPVQITNISLQDFERCTEELRQGFNQWLNSADFRPVVRQVRQMLQLEPRDRVCCLIQTGRIQSPQVKDILHRLPWSWWQVWLRDKVEFALSLREIEFPTSPQEKSGRLRRTRILSILGNTQGIDLACDRQAIAALRRRGASPVFLAQPQRSEFTQLWDEPWDILCFSGHSESNAEGQAGWLFINEREKIEIARLKNALSAACDRGLQMAIFNSCDGLGLANAIADLPIPLLMVWRAAVPDAVAQQFLLYFFQSLSSDRPLYTALGEAREKLELAGIDPYLCQLPILIQNTATLPLTWQQMRRSGQIETSAIAPTSLQERENRRILLNNVSNAWIKTVLENPLQQRLRLELNLEERFNAVDLPCKIAWETPQQQQRSLLSGTRAIDKFDELGTGRTLLLLGEPGSGKTTLLLEMAQELIADAQQDAALPIPVVFNLSTWGDRHRHKTIASWLVEELHEQYQVPKAQGKMWVKHQKLLLLLDGLDEVKAERRLPCLNAINQFHQRYGRTEIVVCSRIGDYNALPQQLKFQGAIYLKSLTPAQIDRYFQQGGETLTALRRLWQGDETLQELARTPLMLNIMTVAYQGLSAEQLPSMNSIEERRQHLFNAYIQRMFERRIVCHLYPQDKSLQWLVWLAQRMVGHSQTLFFIERMQPTWLLTTRQRWGYRLGVRLLFGLICGFASALHFGPMAIENEPFKLPAFAFFGAVAGIIPGLLSGIFPGFLPGLLCGSIFILVSISLTAHLASWERYPLHTVLSPLFIDGVVVGLFLGLTRQSIGIVDTIQWSWSRTWKYLLAGLTFGLVYILARFLLTDTYLNDDYLYNLQELLTFIVLFGLIGGLDKGKEIKETAVPNQGIWRSLANSSLFFAILTPVGTLCGWRYADGIYELICISLAVGILAAFAGGQRSGAVLIQHLILRIFLWKNGCAPWNYARFLDYASERILLQKVGGGYIFTHRLLLEHLARSPI